MTTDLKQIAAMLAETDLDAALEIIDEVYDSGLASRARNELATMRKEIAQLKEKQDAAGTRVVTVKQLERWYLAGMFRAGSRSGKEMRAVIENRIPQPANTNLIEGQGL